MPVAKTFFKARASLIDRLEDHHPRSKRERRPLRTLSRKKLRESIQRDLTWLLNTRTSLPASRFDKRELTVIDYGIPDFGAYHTGSEADRKRLIKRLIRALSFFEPRLKKVSISMEPVAINEKALRIGIDALLVVESVKTPVSFVTVLQEQSATVVLNENR